MTTGMNADEYVILVLSFFFVFWQPTSFYSWRLWRSEWWGIIRDHTPHMPRAVSRAVPAIWLLLFTTTATAWFYVWKSKEDLGSDYDALMWLIIVTVVLIKVWVLLVALAPSQRTFAWASFSVFAPAAATWAAMFALLDAGSRIGTLALVLWSPLVAWTFLATFWLGITIATTDYTSHDFAGAVARYGSGVPYQKSD